ncbi:hypothetical protein TURU_033016 [Turdus rufiventris]|nr:hypothetical protein TURU_033016 [Turdus rufiventris]
MSGVQLGLSNSCCIEGTLRPCDVSKIPFPPHSPYCCHQTVWVVLDRLGTKGDSDWGDIRLAPITSGVLQGSIIGPVLFHIFVNALDTGLEGKLSNLAGDTKPGGAIYSLKGREALKGDLDNLDNLATTNQTKFNNGKC